jgi:hypothetical protein
MLRQGFKVTIQPAEVTTEASQPGRTEETERARADLLSLVMPEENESNALDDAKQLEEAMGARLDELGMVQCLREALQYERAYGGAAIFPGANDGSAKNSNR